MTTNLDFIDRNDIIPYEVYTTEFDRIANIEELVDRDRLEYVHGWMQKRRDFELTDVASVAAISDMSARIASQLEDSGIDPADASVTLLVDGSGSTRGAPAKQMTFATIEACIALENLGVETSVLGYTTSSWKGGQSRQKWVQDGRPRNPGRLCDLLHIVYKRPDESVGASIDHLCALAVDETKKENVDGEALEWAARSASKSGRRHKIVVSLSDGFHPVDDSTLSVNSQSLLIGHLKTVADDIEADGRISLAAVYFDTTSHRWETPSLSAYEALKERGQTIYPRDIVVHVKDEVSNVIGGVAEAVAMGIARASELDHLSDSRYSR